MKIEVNINKKYFLILLGVILVISAGIFVYAQSVQAPNPGHSSEQINVDINGVTKTLQEAIDAGDFASGGAGSSTYVSRSMTLNGAPRTNPSSTQDMEIIATGLLVNGGSSGIILQIKGPSDSDFFTIARMWSQADTPDKLASTFSATIPPLYSYRFRKIAVNGANGVMDENTLVDPITNDGIFNLFEIV